MDKPQYYIGLMSGTSVDGVDAALVAFQQEQIQLIKFVSHPLPETLKKHLIQLNEDPQISLNHLSQLSYEVAQAFIKATTTLLSETQLSGEDITAIGSHGQTIFHAPAIPMTLQIGHPAFIAKATGIQTVADFRVDDMALHGQGAPFAPAFHQQLFQQAQDVFVVNIGGIANISYLPGTTYKAPQNQPGRVTGFDTGPGNGLMDEICQLHFEKAYDSNGDLAASGRVNTALLKHLLAHAYFSQNPPKSTGRDLFNLHWLHQVMQQTSLPIEPLDLLSTLNELTAKTIADAILSIQHSASTLPTPVWITGGGAFNNTLIKRIQHHLPDFRVNSAEKADIAPDAIEAMMCAWLAKQRIAGKTVALSKVTGASRDAVLGGLWLP